MDIIYILNPLIRKLTNFLRETKLCISFRSTNTVYKYDILNFKTPNTKDEDKKSEI
jgi:hypothetical protein